MMHYSVSFSERGDVQGSYPTNTRHDDWETSFLKHGHLFIEYHCSPTVRLDSTQKPIGRVCSHSPANL